MKRLALIGAVVALLALPIAALATDLHEPHQNTAYDSTDFECDTDDLGMIDPGEVLWHFILTQPEASSGNITAEFENAGTVGPIANTVKGGGGGALHFYIITDVPDTLLDAETDVDGGNLVLSHICFIEPVPTPTPDPTPTPTPDPTPTPTPDPTPTPTPDPSPTPDPEPSPTPPPTSMLDVTTSGGISAGLMVLMVGGLMAAWLLVRPVPASAARVAIGGRRGSRNTR